MDFNTLVTECAPWVAPQTMAAIVRTESDFKPFAININGGAKLERQPITKEEAIATAKWLLSNHYNIDMGLGQVNSVNLTKTSLSVEEAFDPCKNLAAAATILHWNYESASKRIPDEQSALQAAISAYNTGSFTKGFGNGYVQKVMNNAKSMSGTTAEQAVVQPIPIVGKAVRSQSTQYGQDVNAPVKLEVIKAAADGVKRDDDKNGTVSVSKSVYGTADAEHGVMVYR